MSTYPLHTLLGLRERAKEEAERALAAASHALSAAQARRVELEARLAQQRSEREARVQAQLARVLGSGADAGALHLMGAHLERLKQAEAAQVEALREQEAVECSALQALELSRAALGEAARELEVLTQHRDAWQQARRAEREAGEERALEEIASARFLARRRP